MKRGFSGIILALSLNIVLVSAALSQQEAFLMGYWSFDEEGADFIQDQSGNGNDAAINGEVNWIDGKMGKALEFTPGANLEIPDSDTLRDMDEYTIGLWLRLNEFAPEWSHIFEKDGSYGITMNTAGGNFRFTPNSSSVWVETDSKVDLDTWYYLTMRWDGSEVSFYIDGAAAGTTDEPIVFNANPVNIAHPAPYTLDGAFDEVKFWAKVLTPEEIAAAMTGNAAVTASAEKLSTTWAEIKED